MCLWQHFNSTEKILHPLNEKSLGVFIEYSHQFHPLDRDDNQRSRQSLLPHEPDWERLDDGRTSPMGPTLSPPCQISIDHPYGTILTRPSHLAQESSPIIIIILYFILVHLHFAPWPKFFGPSSSILGIQYSAHVNRKTALLLPSALTLTGDFFLCR